ncbi:MAG: barstar family protein [Lachnospiraceae bacterium]|nr:barstar family protein [Lachnospiraceae bacterium]
MKRVNLDFSQCVNKSDVHAYLKEVFDFPDYYGQNLDALYDVLGDVAEDVEIVFLEDEEGSCGEWVVDAGAAVRSDEMARYLKNVRRVIEDAAEENGHLFL